ncbi:GPI mannosyltransferase 2 [Irpex rosettiformis]|uniref:GPI mannosyltransferase 2 n=1 Tax=Irpex rosettiformis TaxID=378272 RepID=A0ACB8UGA6_9APHY|nr:GPI mannosyltransferase 2 [Irpex rosettiformis]
MTSSNGYVVKRHLKTLRIASFAAWLLTLILLYVSSLLPLFDSSPDVVLQRTTLRERLAYPLLRWDAFHFVHIAQEGYVYEHEWAFLHGIAAAMKYPARLLRILGLTETTTGSFSTSDLLLSGALLSCLCGSTTTLYRLTLHHFGSPSVAYLAALLSLLPSSPVTLRFSVYNEPFFTYLSYKGMLSCATQDLVAATVFFTGAASLRSNGFMLSGFIVWKSIVEPILAGKRLSIHQISLVGVSTGLIFGPFALHQYSAYKAFCLHDSQDFPWCSATLPSVYGYVQAKYWNIGFLRYWSLAQLPNILLAAPILLSVLSFSYVHFRSCIVPALLRHPVISTSPPTILLRAISKPGESVFLTNSITPHVIYAFVMCCILLFAAHTQIALRLAASMPTTYWAAAWLMVDYPRLGKWWVIWSVVWGTISVVLFSVFLPPA